MIIKSAFLTLFIFIFSGISYSQMGFPNIALAGGPSVGMYLNNTDELNTQLRLAGFPEFSNKFFTLGGGGFIDFEISKRKSNEFLRVGGLGLGFSSHKESTVNDSLTKAATLNFGIGGLSVEYVRCITPIFDITFGVLLATGSLKLDLYQYGNDYGTYSQIWGELGGNTSSANLTRNFKVRYYSVQPELGFGLLVKKAMYLRLQAGYNFAGLGSWKVDNDVEVKNFPTGIKANGFNISLGVNFGIFFRED